MPEHLSASRRTVLKGLGAATAASLPFSGAVGAATVDDELDTTGDELQESLVVFTSNPAVDRLRHLDLASGYHRFEAVPVGYTKLTGEQVAEVAEWPEVRRVEANAELEYYNDDGRETTGADEVHADLGYTGENVHAAVIDTGVDGSHPDLEGNLVHNFRYVDPLSDSEDTVWVDAGPVNTDDNGHGTHTSGSVAGDGTKSDGEYRGLAPDADLTVYSAGLTLLVVHAVAAMDDLVARKRAGETDVQLVSNSYGTSGGGDFDPENSLNVSTWAASEAGILPLFSAGNSGPEDRTLNQYAKAPHVLGVAATNADRTVTDFSSRGRADGSNHDRKKALRNLEKYYAANKSGEAVEEGGYSGVLGPADSEYHEWEAPKKAGFVEATLSWADGAQDVDFYLRKGGPDGEAVASGATLNHPEELAAAVDGGETYYFEVRPFANVTTDYEISYAAFEGIKGNVTPYGVYRPGVGAKGADVMSTLNPAHPLQGYAVDPETYYGLMSGTSMSCPITAGAAALVFDAYYEATGEHADPIDVLNTLEAEAEDAHEGYEPANMGAGYVNALAAVERAAEGNLASFGEVKLVSG